MHGMGNDAGTAAIEISKLTKSRSDSSPSAVRSAAPLSQRVWATMTTPVRLLEMPRVSHTSLPMNQGSPYWSASVRSCCPLEGELLDFVAHRVSFSVFI